MHRLIVYWAVFVIATAAGLVTRHEGVIKAALVFTSLGGVLLHFVEGYRVASWAADHHPDGAFRMNWRWFFSDWRGDDLGDPELRKRLDEYRSYRLLGTIIVITNVIVAMTALR